MHTSLPLSWLRATRGTALLLLLHACNSDSTALQMQDADIKHTPPPSVARQPTYETQQDPTWGARIATARRKSLQQITTDTKGLIAEGDRIKSTAALIKALNNPRTTDKKVLRRIFKAYNALFLAQSFAECDDDDIDQYSRLAKVKPRDALTRKLLETYVEVWRNKVKEGFKAKDYAEGVKNVPRTDRRESLQGRPHLTY